MIFSYRHQRNIVESRSVVRMIIMVNFYVHYYSNNLSVKAERKSDLRAYYTLCPKKLSPFCFSE